MSTCALDDDVAPQIGTEDIAALRTLADVVEPVKDYALFESVKGTWNFRAPLNRLVDEANPAQHLAQADAANAPEANLLPVIVQPVRQLIEATGRQIQKPWRAANFIPETV